MLRVKILIFFIASAFPLYSQITFEKTYGDTSYNIGYSVIQTADSGYIIAGKTYSEPDYYWDIYLIKTDVYGNLRWSYGYPFLNNDEAKGVKPTSDGGYIIIGDGLGSYLPSTDLLLIKIDSLGNEVWRRFYGSTFSDYGEAVLEVEDGYVAAGITYADSYNRRADVYLIKTTTEGDTIWTKNYGGESYDFGHSAYNEYLSDVNGRGVWRSTDYGNSWQPFNDGLGDRFVYSLKRNTRNNHIFAGTGVSFYTKIGTPSPPHWDERGELYYTFVPELFATNQGLNCVSHHHFIKHTNNEFTTRSGFANISGKLNYTFASHYNNGDLILLGRGYMFTGDPPEGQVSFVLYKSSDGGSNWNSKWQAQDAQMINDIAISLSSPNWAYAVLRDVMGHNLPLLLVSSNSGENWTEKSGPAFCDELNKVVIDPFNSQHIFSSFSRTLLPYVWYSSDAGNSWILKINGLPSHPVYALTYDPTDSDILYCGTDLAGIYKTYNRGALWIECNNGLNYNGCSTLNIEADPEEPSIVYAALFNYSTNDGDVYLSVDGGGKWLLHNGGLHYFFCPTDLSINPNSPDITYLGTEKGIYYYDPPFNKHLVSSSDSATCYNNGRHLVRDEGTDELLVTYESGGVVYLTGSEDYGNTWSRKLSPGDGAYPVVARGTYSYILYVKHNDIDTLYFAKYTGALGSGDWNNYVLYTSSNTIGPSPLLSMLLETGTPVLTYPCQRRMIL